MPEGWERNELLERAEALRETIREVIPVGREERDAALKNINEAVYWALEAEEFNATTQGERDDETR